MVQLRLIHMLIQREIKLKCLTVLLGIAAVAGSASAAPILYNINFEAGVNPAPSGSFRYDSVAGEFTDFFVVWTGIQFDLTASANNPTGVTGACNTSGNGAADSFSILNLNPCGHIGGVTVWYAGDNGPNNSYFGITPGIGVAGAGYILAQSSQSSGRPNIDQSRLTLFPDSVPEPAPVPEPASVAQFVSGGVLLAALRRRSAAPPTLAKAAKQ